MVTAEIREDTEQQISGLKRQLLDKDIALQNSQEALELDTQFGALHFERLMNRAPNLIARLLSVRTVVLTVGESATSNNRLFDANGKLTPYQYLVDRVLEAENRITMENRTGLPLISPRTYHTGSLGVMIIERDATKESDHSSSPVLKSVASVFAKHIPGAYALSLLSRATDRRFLPAILKSPELIKNGKIVNASIIFGDLIGSSTLAATMKLEDFVSMINAYYTQVDRIIEVYNGVIDKFIGDAFMAHFNTLYPQEKHVDAALEAALLIQEALQELSNERNKKGLQTCQFRVGIHTGEVIVGSIGSPTRSDLTIIGDPVNTTKRIQEAGKGGKVLVSLNVVLANKNKSIQFDQVGEINPKGTNTNVVLYQASYAPATFLALPSDSGRVI